MVHEFQQRSKEIFEQQVLCHIDKRGDTGKGKLVFYSKIKQIYRRELYLQLQNVNSRNAIRNLRTSTHKLNIETGRYKGINRDERICELCVLNTVKTEIHFLTECTAFTDERKSFLAELNTTTDMRADKMDINLTNYIFLSNDLAILNKFGK